jgi:N4-gp56 family major capsid protein
MATTSTTDGTIAYQFRNYFSKELLKKILPQLQLQAFAKKATLPERTGSKAITFFRFNEPSTTTIVATATEGTTPSASEKLLTIDRIEATLVQYVQTIAISDILSATELFNHVEEAVRQQGEDAALHCDKIIRAELASNVTNKQYLYAGASTNWAGVVAAPTVGISTADVLDAATSIKRYSARPIGNSYALVVPVEVSRDLQRDTNWLNVSAYSAPDGFFNGEVGKIYGCRVMETTNGWRSGNTGTQYTYQADGPAFSSFLLGMDSFGVPNLSSQSPFSPKVMIADGADKADPAGLKTTIAFKSFYAAKVLQPKHICEIYSGTGFAA